MYLIESASFILAIILFHSLIGKLSALRALYSGKIHAIALRELTGIERRAELEQRFGAADENDLFALKPMQVLAGRRWWRWLIGNMALEALLFYWLLAMVLGSLPPSPAAPLVALIYWLVAHFISYKGFKISRPEVEAELAAKATRERERSMSLRKDG